VGGDETPRSLPWPGWSPAMAPAFLVVFAVTSPSDVAFLLREPLGWATVAAAAAFETAGIFWTNHIVRGPTP
jgi:Flp pilus assembly protein TadB